MEVSTTVAGPNNFFQNYAVYVIEIYSEMCVCKNKVDVVAFPSVSKTSRVGLMTGRI